MDLLGAWFRVLGREHGLRLGESWISVQGWADKLGGAGPAPVALSPSASSFLSCRFIYELEHFNGVAELLEILGR